MDGLEAIFRWLHILAGITWIGLLYFFNWVNGPFQGKIDGPTKKIVNPELMPRALYWFRWGAAYTWFTGVLLLALVVPACASASIVVTRHCTQLTSFALIIVVIR